MSLAPTEGHRLFREWRKTAGKNNQELADLLGVNGSQVSRWTTTNARPDLQQIIILAELAQIPPGAWLTKREFKTVEKKTGRAA